MHASHLTMHMGINLLEMMYYLALGAQVPGGGGGGGPVPV
jgi:hypothetical protein